MKLQMFKIVALVALFMGWFSCTSNSDDSQGYRFQWDGSLQREEFRPINAGTKSSSFAIDSNIVSFAVPYLVGTTANEHLPRPGWGSPESFSPHFWTIALIMAKRTNVTKLSPVITLAPGATLTWIHHTIGAQNFSEQVDYTGIAKVGALDFSKQVAFTVIAPDGSTVSYNFMAVAIGDDLGPCSNCPP